MNIENTTWAYDGFKLECAPSKNPCMTCGKADANNRCTYCKISYCNQVCQKKSWKSHKKVCKSLDQYRTILASPDSAIKMAIYGSLILALRMKKSKWNESFTNVRDNFDALYHHSHLVHTSINIGISFDDLRIDDVGFADSDWKRQIGATGLELANVSMTGCRCILYSPILLGHLHGRSDVHKILTIVYILAELMAENTAPSVCYSIEPMHQLCTIGESESSLREVVVGNYGVNGNQRCIYYVFIIPYGKITTDVPVTSDSRVMWDHCTSTLPDSNHVLMIMCQGSESMIVQSYFGHYSSKEWLDFKEPLQYISPLPGPKLKGWTRKLAPTPKYRGTLDQSTLSRLCVDIDILTTPGNHIQRYSDITGIIHDTDSIDKKYHIRFYRYQLD